MGDHIAWLASDDRGTPNQAALDSYRELLEVGAASAISHEAAVTITVTQERLPRHRTGRKDPDEQLRRALVTSVRSEEHTSELQSLMRISYAVSCLKNTNNTT